MKTTLIYAGIGGKGFASVGQGMDSGWISHGLAYLSACAREKGFEIDFIDLRALNGWEAFKEQVLARQPTVCGLTMMSVDFNPVMKCIDIIKKIAPSTSVVVGGAHATLATEEVLANPKIDYVVTGEGEITFPKLLSAIQSGSPPNRRLLVGERPDLDSIPFPDRDLFLNEWRRAGYDLSSPEAPFVPELPPPFVTLIAGRGCRYNCSFCKPGEDLIFGKGTRRRSVANIIAELKYLDERYHLNSFMFHDDTLTEDRRWVSEFCRVYKAEGFQAPFFCQSRAEIIVHHEDMVAEMVNAGLRGFFIGFESGSDRVLWFLRKGTTRDANIAAADVCKKYGISIWANYMLGLPTETKGEVMETVSMLKRIDPDYYSPAFYTPHPGSDLYDYCLEHGLSLITDHESYRRNPTEPKIKGHDCAFLNWALAESQKRTLTNACKRKARYLLQCYASPRKAMRKFKKLTRV